MRRSRGRWRRSIICDHIHASVRKLEAATFVPASSANRRRMRGVMCDRQKDRKMEDRQAHTQPAPKRDHLEDLLCGTTRTGG